MAASTVLFPCHTYLCYPTAGSHRIRAQERPPRRRRQKTLFVSSIYNRKASTFTYRTSANVPLRNFPGAPPVRFEEYMEDMGRVVEAIIPEKSTAQRLSQDEWRIKMPVIECLFLKTQPVADIRVTTKSNGQDYPPHVPSHIPKLCETHIIKCELQGLHSAYTPHLFNLEASGTLYPVTHGTDGSCMIKNQLEANITIGFSPLLSWVPQHVMDDIVRSIVRTIVEEIKKGFTVRLLADYWSFQRSKSQNSA
ncbi:hypothetical protein QN277_020584 [Acacia crassicarpa]|uniref:Uncharacterized protein n=1 Tax=Acacia crassicarpa TaxID=499986 RepID=A0AAE1KF44_9FABA|nr:hypothetical protein QN277_020584 [Acacia crassicarpa]